MDKRKVVVVTWGDAHATLDAEHDDVLRDTVPEVTHSVGWLIAKNQHGIVLGMDIYEADTHNIGSTAFIPWGMVTKVTQYQEE